MNDTETPTPASARGRSSYTLDLRKGGSTPWPLKTKIKRALWNLTWSLFRFSPRRRGNPWRLSLLRAFGAKIHGDPLIHPQCTILQPWELEIGEFSAIGERAEIYNYARVIIGPMTVVSQYTFLCTGTHDYTHPYMPLTWKPITIGAECWVAAGAFIGPGVTVHDGAVVGAYAVVTKDVPPWTVSAGNPCKVIKPRIMQSLTPDDL